MKKLLLPLAVGALCCCKGAAQVNATATSTVIPENATAAAATVIPGQWIVTYTPGCVEAAPGNGMTSVLAVSANVTDYVNGSEVQHVFTTFNGAVISNAFVNKTELGDLTCVASVRHDIVVSGQYLFLEGDGPVDVESRRELLETQQPNIARVAGGKPYTGSNRIWIIDSGIDLTHPELNVNLALSKNFVKSDTDTVSTFGDKNGHGTHVAGIAAARGKNGIGFAGVAAGAELVSVRVLDENAMGALSDILKGVEYANYHAKKGDVVNLSVGSLGTYASLSNAIIAGGKAGIFYSISAGNSYKLAEDEVPANTNGVNVYTVSAMDSNDYLAYFSNYGYGVDFAAPGVNILSTWLDGKYYRLSGTSASSPHVAGVALVTGTYICTDGKVHTRGLGSESPIRVVCAAGVIPAPTPTPKPSPTTANPATPSQGSCSTLWNQCGGQNWKGATCCQSGLQCVKKTVWYSQCRPKAGTTTPKPSPTPTTVATGGASGPCAAVWKQCGGKNYHGTTCCKAGSHCVKNSDWYSQCKPLTVSGQNTCSALWQQCGGGKNYTGPKCCRAGSHCVVFGPYFSQCRRAASGSGTGTGTATGQGQGSGDPAPAPVAPKPAPAPPAPSTPVAQPQPKPQPQPEPAPVPAPEPAPVPAPEPAPVPAPEPMPVPITSAPQSIPDPVPVPVPLPPPPTSAPQSTPVPKPVPVPVPEPAPVVPEPVPVPVPVPVITSAPMTAAIPAPEPVPVVPTTPIVPTTPTTPP